MAHEVAVKEAPSKQRAKGKEGDKGKGEAQRRWHLADLWSQVSGKQRKKDRHRLIEHCPLLIKAMMIALIP